MTVVEVQDLVKHYPGERSWFGLGAPRAAVRAVDGVSFTIASGRTLGLLSRSIVGRPDDAAAAGADRGQGPLRWQRRVRPRRRATPRAQASDADRVSGSLQLAQSAHDRRGNAAGAAGNPPVERCRVRAAGRGGTGRG